ncbi:MAG TPA: transposase, partial [Ktedonobacterales bacterium]|jgi:REP element-mobilizing transposase RayT
LRGDVERHIYRAIGAKCEELGIEMVALGGIEDHVHLLVGLPATLSIADLVKHIKGASFHLRNEQSPSKDTFFKWQGAYGACSVSLDDLSKVAEYIKHQRSHHATGTLNPTLEQIFAEKPGSRPGT